MTKTAAIPFVVMLATLALAGTVRAEEEAETCNALFVHSAQGVTLDADTLTMKGVSPTVIYFCDRPVRFAGHLSVEDFLDSVSKGKDSFAEDPPNAVVSIFSGEERGSGAGSLRAAFAGTVGVGSRPPRPARPGACVRFSQSPSERRDASSGSWQRRTFWASSRPPARRRSSC
jgi:hypothetical protein